MQIADGGGLFRLHANGLTLRKQGYEIYSVPHGDVCAAEGRAEWAYGMQRGDWSVLSKTKTTLRANSEAFVIRARMRAWEGDTLVKELEWDERIPRNNL